MVHYHSFIERIVPGMRHGVIHAVDPKTLAALCGVTATRRASPIALTCAACVAILREKA